MHKGLAAGMAALILLGLASVARPATTGTLEELEKIVVIGRLPGPPLWKVSNAEHVLWILPLIEMYPKNVEWDSTRIEQLIAQSQQYIDGPRVSGGMALGNPLLLPWAVAIVSKVYFNTTDLPDDRKLADVLEPDLYQRFATLKAGYFPKNRKIEGMSVMAATNTLRKEMLERENLAYMPSSPFMEKMRKWQSRNKTLRQTRVGMSADVGFTSKEFKAYTKAIDEMLDSGRTVPSHVACLEQGVAYFENIAQVEKLADAWMRGNVQGLTSLTPLNDGTGSCSELHLDGTALERLRKKFPDVVARLTQDRQALLKASRKIWLSTATGALEKNTTTFSQLPLNEILDNAGLVAQLQAKGYTVEVSAR